MKSFNIITASLLLASALTAAAHADPVSVKPLASIKIPDSPGKFDILRVDGRRHRLLAAHEGDRTADFFDLAGNSLITRLKLGAAVDTAVDPESKYYYVSVQDSQRVAVVDAGSLKEVGSVSLDGPTDAIIYEPRNRKVYVTHDNGANVWVIDPITLKLAGSVVIPGAPELMEYDASADRIYLNIKTKDLVAVIDPATNQTVAQWSTAPATRPHGLALDSVHHLVFVAGANGKLVALDAGSGRVVATAAIAEKVDQIAYDAGKGLLYCAAGGRATVLHVSGVTLTAAGEITTAASARNIAVDAGTGAVWSTYTDGGSSFATGWVVQQE